MPSLSARAVAAVLAVRPNRRLMADREQFRADVARRQVRPSSYRPPRWLGGRVDVSAQAGWVPVGVVAGAEPVHPEWTLYSITPRAGEPVARAVYFHGGCYTAEIHPAHWLVAASLARRAAAQVSVPIYPLAPRATAARTVPAAAELLGALLAAPGAPLTVIGDSAGGGLALAAVQRLVTSKAALPVRLILISPWVDVRLPDPQVPGRQEDDLMLALPGLEEAGRLWAGGLPSDDPRVSPVHGPMEGLPPMAVFSGTADMLNPQARRLVELARSRGVTAELHEVAGAHHVYPLMPTREGAAARRRLVELVRG